MEIIEIKPTLVINFAVTQNEIDRGIEKSERNCPIALALSKIELFQKVHVFRSETFINYNNILLIAKNPLNVQDFIFDFDCKNPVSPTCFYLEFYPQPLC